MNTKLILAEILNRNDISDEERSTWKTPEVSDKKIWDEFQSGSDVAFEFMYRSHEKVLFLYGMKIIRDTDLVWDTIQDLFVELWHSRTKLAKTKSIKPYLYRALRYKLLRKASQQHKILQLVEKEYETVDSSSEKNRFEEDQHEDEIRKKLKIAFTKLSRKQHEIMYLRFYDGLTIKEIAKITGMKKKTVYYNLSRALKLLSELREDLDHLLLFICIHWYKESGNN